jgi:CheY-like chemotaxis protein
MLVDDTMLCNKVVGMILTKMGVHHDSCFSGKEAIEKIKQYGNSIPIKLILMDINMPEMNGIEV